MAYRISRNIEASFVDFLKTEFLADWGSENVEVAFARIYEIDLPSILVQVGTSDHNRVELGSSSTLRNTQVLLNVFTKSEGMQRDIKDWLITKIKSGIPYYNFTISGGVVTSKIADGRLRVLNIEDTPINFDTDRDKLDRHDRFRWLITLQVSRGKLET